MIDLRANFKSKYDDLSCPLCSSATHNQPHLLNCTVLKNKLKTKEAALGCIEYEDPLRKAKKQEEKTHLYKEHKNINKRNQEINTSCY